METYRKTSNKIKISCIIPTCDRAEYLAETLKSVLAQSEAPYEIIIVNNGGSPVVLPENIKNKVIVYDIVPYAGVAQARNFGASMASGDYLAFLDDDDLWNPDYLRNIKKALTEESAACVISRLDQLHGDQIKPFRNPQNNITIANILIANPGITGSNIVIAKEVFLKLHGFDPKLPPSEDKSLILEALLNKLKIKTLPENQALWRTDTNTSRLTDSARMAEGIFQFTRKYSWLMNKKQYLTNWQKIYIHRSVSGKKIAYLQYLTIRIILILLKLISFK